MATPEKSEVVHASVFDPRHALFKSCRNDRSECRVVSCKGKERCGLYARGECVELVSVLKSAYCPYGRCSVEQGPTKRSHKIGSWVRGREETHKDALHRLKYPNQVMAMVGDYVFLPYAHMTMNEKVPFLSHSSLFVSGNCFLPLDKFTIETIIELVDFRPSALMGGEISSYQREEVPKFLQHLREKMPGLFAQVVAKKPELSSKAGAFSPVGRKALLRTLARGSKVVKTGETWTWDGEYLSSTNHRILFPVAEYSEISVRIKPEAEAIVEVSSLDQVGPETVFVT